MAQDSPLKTFPCTVLAMASLCPGCTRGISMATSRSRVWTVTGPMCMSTYRGCHTGPRRTSPCTTPGPAPGSRTWPLRSRTGRMTGDSRRAVKNRVQLIINKPLQGMAPTECLPSACLPACLLACLLTCLLACLLACLLSCLLARLLACLLACLLPACLTACFPACLLTCLLACLLACLLPCLLACLLACPKTPLGALECY